MSGEPPTSRNAQIPTPRSPLLTPNSQLVTLVLVLLPQLWFGLRPAWTTAGGDFANYYTAAWIVASGEDLTPAYSDFLWFQQHVEAVGFSRQLAGFVPHPPATALVMLPLVGLAPLAAKHVWTVLSVLVAVVCAFVLGRLVSSPRTGFPTVVGAVCLLATGVALANDLAFGQMYLPLLLSLALFALLMERSPFWAGVSLGAMLPVKPFALPILLYCLATRRWRAAAGCVATALALVAASASVLGRPIYEEYVRSVLPHQLAGRLQDPFHPLWQSWGSLARRMFLYEPTLNPVPAASAPWFAGAVPALAGALGWGAVALVLYATPGRTREHVALLVIASLALAPGGATYHLVLLALPYALLWDRGSGVGADSEASDRGEAHVSQATPAPGPWPPTPVLACAALLALPLPSFARSFDGGWTTPLAYPRLWLLTALTAVVAVWLARQATRRPSRPVVAGLGVAAVAVTAAAAVRALPRVYDAATPVAISAPEISGPDRAPVARPSIRAGTLVFLAANPAAARYELFTTSERIGLSRIPEAERSALSPDGRLLAFVSDRAGNDDVWVRHLATGEERRVTSDPAADREPCWEDARHLVFATDRGRGLAYTTLYRIAP